MHTNRSLLVLLLLLAAAAAGFWLFSSPAASGAPTVPTASAPAAVEAARAAAASADAARPQAQAKPAERVELAPSAASGPALVGQVIDAEGRPVAGAVVECAPGLGFGPGNLADVDLGEMLQDFDPVAWQQRQKQQLLQLVEVTTDAEGRFRLTPRGTASSVGLRVKARGFALLDRSVRRPAGKDTDLGAMQLQRGAVVQGRVVDRQGNPVAGANVMCPRHVQQKMFDKLDLELPEADDAEWLRLEGGVVSDDAGRFELENVEDGEFSLYAWHPQHPPARRHDLQVSAGQTLRDVSIELDPGAVIRGRVVGAPPAAAGLRILAAAVKPAESGSPLALAGDLLSDPDLGLAERKVDAGDDGSFALVGLRADGRYRVWAAQDGSSLSGNVPCSKPVEVAAGSTGVELRYELGLTVTFVAVDARTRAPIETLWIGPELRGGADDLGDLMMMMPGSGPRVRHCAGGLVELRDLRPKPGQTLTLTVEAIGFRRLQRESIELPAQGRVDLGTLALEPAPVVQIAVLDAAGGRPVVGASVRLQVLGDDAQPDPKTLWGGGPGAGRSDDDGRCTLNVPAGADRVVVHVERKPYAPCASPPLAIEEPVTQCEVRLLRGGRVEVTVLGADGEPSANAVVEHRVPAEAGDHSLQAMMARMTGDRHKTDAHGVARFDRLQPGVHCFRLGSDAADPMAMAFAAASGGADESGWQTVVVADGGEATLQLQQAATATLHGIVRENGVPLAGASIALVADDAHDEMQMMSQMMSQVMGTKGGHQTRSADDGSYRLADLPAGAHRLRVTHAKRAMPASFAVTLQAGDRLLDIDLDVASLRGTVRDPQGKPIAGATVRVRRGPSRGADPSEQMMGEAIGDAMSGMMPGIDSGGVKAVTDEAGNYELGGVEAGVPLVVRAEAKGFAPTTSAPVQVERAGSLSGVDIAMLAAGSVEVRVAGAGGMAMVMARWAGDEPDVALVMQRLQQGSATLQGLRPGKWMVMVRTMRMQKSEPIEREVEVTAGETAVIEFEKQ